MAVEQHAVTTTVSANVSGGDGHLSGEVDSRAWGYNGGRTQYFPGDAVYLLIFKSSNVSIVGQTAVGGSLGKQSGAIGEYPVREGVHFSSPLGTMSKPAQTIEVVSSHFSNCSGGQSDHISETHLIRLPTWTPTLSISSPPPYGFMFVEYTPYGEVWKLSNLTIPSGVKVFSYPINAVFWGVATPLF